MRGEFARWRCHQPPGRVARAARGGEVFSRHQWRLRRKPYYVEHWL